MTELAEIESEQIEGMCLVRVRGEIDMSNAKPLAAEIEHSMPTGTSTLVLDLSATTYIDSVGVGLLLRLSERLRSRRQELRLVVPQTSSIRAVLDLAGIAGAMRVEPDPGEAFANAPDPS